MGDVNYRYTPCLQAGDLLEQHFDFTRREHRRGFVEDQHMAIADQVAGDLDHLLMTDTQLTDRRVRVDCIEADLSHGFNGGLAQLLAADPATIVRQIVEKQVFRHRQGRQ